MRLDLICLSSSNTFTGSHQNTLENVPVIVVTWVLFSSRTVTLLGVINIVGNFAGLSSAVSVIQLLQQQHAGFGLSRALYTHYVMALENLKRYLFPCKVTLAPKSEFHA